MTTEITKQNEAPITKIRSMLEGKKADLSMALPKHLTVDRLLRVALTACNKTPKLLECTRESLLSCVMDCASLGLEPDAALGRAYLIPYGQTCTLVIGYKGLADLAYRSGMVDSLDAYAVHENDRFELTLGLSPDIVHVPCPTDPGAFKGVYAVARLKGTTFPKFVYMTKAEIDAIRKRSRASSNGPWVTDYEEMAKKTAVKRLAKLLPLSVEFSDALSKDQEFEFNEPKVVEIRKPLFESPEKAIDLPPENPEPPTKEEKPKKAVKHATLVEEPLLPTPVPECKTEFPENTAPTAGIKTARMEKFCKDNGIEFSEALKWIGETGFASFDDYPDQQINLIFSQPKQFKKTIEALKDL